MTSLLRRAIAVAALVALHAGSALAATVALETSIGLEVGSYLRTGPFTDLDDLHVAPGATNLAAHQLISLGSPPASTLVDASASLAFNGAANGTFHLDWVNRADVPGGPNIPSSGGRVVAVPVPNSIYNNDGQNKALATYAFEIGGDGAVTVAVTWASTVVDPHSSAGLQDFLFKALTTPVARIDQIRAGQAFASDGTGQQKVRSAGERPFQFSGQVGDIFVLRLLPGYLFSQDGSRVNSELDASVNIDFAITAPGGWAAVPLPSPVILCLSGIAAFGSVARHRRRPGRNASPHCSHVSCCSRQFARKIRLCSQNPPRHTA